MKLPRINVYRCEYHCNTVTVDVDHGVTPFMIGCRSRSRPDRPIAKDKLDKKGFCIGTGMSCFYPKVPRPAHIPEPSWEWFKPTKEEFEMLDIEQKDENHFKQGGLFLRPR